MSVVFRQPTGTEGAFRRSLALVLKAALREYDADTTCIYEYSAGVLTLVAAEGSQPGRLESATIELSERASMWLRGLASPATATEAQTHERTADLPEVLFHRLAALMVAPVLSNRVLRGIVTVGWRDSHPSPAGQADASSLKLLADSASLLLERGGNIVPPQS